eukprot:TRINITY_DN13891_c0_g1_i1.p1 TRINITY_DN13891_c0_g1~~TRINITY_DN13891_c0_g1_i1.p1  ORF type:complete len:281 (+),score=28.02 TRINITY_DN13891_c0_g1_i1:71-844(+)
MLAAASAVRRVGGRGVSSFACVTRGRSWSAAPFSTATSSMLQQGGLEELPSLSISSWDDFQRGLSSVPRPLVASVSTSMGPTPLLPVTVDERGLSSIPCIIVPPSPASEQTPKEILVPGPSPFSDGIVFGEQRRMGCPASGSCSYEAPAASNNEASVDIPCDGRDSIAPLECIKFTKRGRHKSQGKEEKWWLEYDPPKQNYLSGFGRGPHFGNSINKQDWPIKMLPVYYKKNWNKRERMRFAFRKNGVELDIPKWGG